MLPHLNKPAKDLQSRVVYSKLACHWSGWSREEEVNATVDDDKDITMATDV